MKLVDTSSWIEFLRGEKNECSRRVGDLLKANEAAWSEPIQLELWNGAHRDEWHTLEELETLIVPLHVDATVWQKSIGLARKCRAAGLTVPATDLLIAACALHHRLEVEHNDQHYPKILPLGADF